MIRLFIHSQLCRPRGAYLFCSNLYPSEASGQESSAKLMKEVLMSEFIKGERTITQSTLSHWNQEIIEENSKPTEEYLLALINQRYCLWNVIELAELILRSSNDSNNSQIEMLFLTNAQALFPESFLCQQLLLRIHSNLQFLVQNRVKVGKAIAQSYLGNLKLFSILQSKSQKPFSELYKRISFTFSQYLEIYYDIAIILSNPDLLQPNYIKKTAAYFEHHPKNPVIRRKSAVFNQVQLWTYHTMARFIKDILSKNWAQERQMVSDLMHIVDKLFINVLHHRKKSPELSLLFEIAFPSKFESEIERANMVRFLLNFFTSKNLENIDQPSLDKYHIKLLGPSKESQQISAQGQRLLHEYLILLTINAVYVPTVRLTEVLGID